MKEAYKGKYLKKRFMNDFIENRVGLPVEDEKLYIVTGSSPTGAKNKDGSTRWNIYVEELRIIEEDKT